MKQESRELIESLKLHKEVHLLFSVLLDIFGKS